MKKRFILSAVAVMAFGCFAQAMAQDGVLPLTGLELAAAEEGALAANNGGENELDVTAPEAEDQALLASDDSTVDQTNVRLGEVDVDVDVSVAVSDLDGTVSGNTFAATGANEGGAASFTTGANTLSDRVMQNATGLLMTSQSSGNASLTQQSVNVQANIGSIR